MKTWKIGISSADGAPVTAPILLKGSIYNNLETASSLGYDGIEVHMRETADIEFDRVEAIQKERNVRVVMLITGRLNTEGHLSLLDDDENIAAAAREGLKRYIEKAGRIGAGIVIGWAKGNVPAGKPREPYMDRLAQHLAVLGEYGLAHHVPVNLEVINRYETNVFNTARETADFIRKYELKNCFVHLDTFHMNIEEADMLEAIRYAGPYLGYFHVADNDRNYVSHGALDFKGIFDTLKATGYKGFVTVECLPLPDAMAAASQSLQSIRRIME